MLGNLGKCREVKRDLRSESTQRLDREYDFFRCIVRIQQDTNNVTLRCFHSVTDDSIYIEPNTWKGHELIKTVLPFKILCTLIKTVLEKQVNKSSASVLRSPYISSLIRNLWLNLLMQAPSRGKKCTSSPKPPASGGDKTSCLIGTRIVNLTTHLHLVPRLRMSGPIPPPQPIFMACKGKTLSFKRKANNLASINVTVSVSLYPSYCTSLGYSSI
jgi:hypothetical protein